MKPAKLATSFSNPIDFSRLHFLQSRVRASLLQDPAPFQMRSRLATMAAPPSVGDGDDMNASLWGELQSFIDLSMIYAKLPLAPFFRLRQVCKEWNHLASDRQFLEQNFKPPISSNPYFVLTRPSGGHVLLTSEGSSWRSTPVPRARCEVSGLLFEDSDRNRVFDLHTRVFHTLPPLPAVVQAPALLEEEEDDYEDPLILMTVDTTLIPYEFRVIIADEIIGTRIYDSRSGAWMYKPSTHGYMHHSTFGTSCVLYDKFLSIRVGNYFEGWYDVLTYDLERDEWDSLQLGNIQDVWAYSDIGVWQDRWFVFAVNNEVEEESFLNVWECLSNFEKPWVDFDSMPRDLCKWVKSDLEQLHVMVKFYGEHVLLYNHEEGEERAILYNLDQKTWDKIEWRATPMLQKRACSRNDL